MPTPALCMEPMHSRSTELRGRALLRQPALNKGTAFSAEERRSNLMLFNWILVEHLEGVLAVALDVGTNRDNLLNDPLYPGLRKRRLQGDAYLAFVDEFVQAVQEECPGACLHWEDFGTGHARQLLDRYRDVLPSFNDDIQGTSGVASAAVLAACRGLGQPLAQQAEAHWSPEYRPLLPLAP